MISARTYRTADRFALDLEAIGHATAKQALSAKRDRKLAMKRRNRRSNYHGVGA